MILPDLYYYIITTVTNMGKKNNIILMKTSEPNANIKPWNQFNID